MTIPYTQSSDSQEIPPPYYFPGVTVNAFVWEAHINRVQEYCDKFFNLGDQRERGFVYKAAPMWPYAMLLFLEYPMMIATSPASIAPEVSYAQQGHAQQAEVFVALPVIRYGVGPANFALDTALEWIMPFIVVGNTMSAVCGREMLGIPKLLAEINTKPPADAFPGSFTAKVKLPGWPTSRAEQEVEPFLNVETAPVLPTYRGKAPASSFWSLFESREAGWGFDESASIVSFLDQYMAGLPSTLEMRTVTLKQVRDAKDPTKALYQALISCRTHYDNLREFSFYNEEDVNITFNTAGSFRDVVEIFRDVPPHDLSTHHVIKAKAAFTFVADIEFGDMLTTYTYSVDRGANIAPLRAVSNLAAPWSRPWLGLFRRQRP